MWATSTGRPWQWNHSQVSRVYGNAYWPYSISATKVNSSGTQQGKARSLASCVLINHPCWSSLLPYPVSQIMAGLSYLTSTESLMTTRDQQTAYHYCQGPSGLLWDRRLLRLLQTSQTGWELVNLRESLGKRSASVETSHSSKQPLGGCKKKGRLYRKAKKDNAMWQEFVVYQRTSKSALNRAHWQYVNGILTRAYLEQGDQKPFWRYIHSQRQDNQGVSPLRIRG